MTTATLSFLRVQQKAKAINFPKANWKMVCSVGFIVSFALLVFYVWQVNDLTRGSFLINSYEKQISQLSDENKNLQVSFAENSFLSQAQQKAEALHFQKVTFASVKYIEILDNSVAIAKEGGIK